ncbi:unnamed protein product [Effrenium voratum]|nr:unnamed protein product [Effrenium voratum]|mmetsp:Transcript_28672/g.68207  ORF Transcript_28672/g.68207 Transcript_28672/m.68207 type:complete len:436 (+) Transcript_28672:42-1349(+)
MDAALQVADVAKGYLQTAWNAAAAYHDRLEPVGAKVAAAQVQLHDYVVRLSSVPQVQGALEYISEVGLVQDVAHAALGQRKLPPESLLWVLLMVMGFVLLTLLVVPKAKLGVYSFFYFFLASDKKPCKPTDMKLDKNSPKCKRMKIVFIRHGESQWNSVFNKGWKIFLPFRLVRALIKEALMTFQRDSIFYDSPLNDVGMKQGWDLLAFLASQPAGCREPGTCHKAVEQLQPEDIVSIILGDAGESLVASSILRRAVSTALIALSPRLLKSTFAKDRVHLMTSLQEISRNVDTLAISRARSLPKCPPDEAKMKNMGDLMSHWYKTRLDHRQHLGNKTLGMKADKRQKQFVKWVFDQKDIDCIVVAGHSLWFREFFKSFMPKSSTHVAKTTKMVNCGVVAFDLYRSEQHGTEIIRIPPEGIKEIYGGFEVKKKKKA